ncbi:MAG: hypothetical protein MZV64_11585, partial [Ignavibacteriales bacterium]|nr:hypothetical protein [Ignavibacteriales bacterium]
MTASGPRPSSSRSGKPWSTTATSSSRATTGRCCTKSRTEADPLLRSDLWRAEITETGWREGTPLPSPVNTADNDESYASDTAGGDLYFFSNRPGGKGRFDLYACPFKDGAYGERRQPGVPEHGVPGMGPVRRSRRKLSPLLLHQAGRIGRGRHLYRLQGQGRRVGIARPSGP